LILQIKLDYDYCTNINRGSVHELQAETIIADIISANKTFFY